MVKGAGLFAAAVAAILVAAAPAGAQRALGTQLSVPAPAGAGYRTSTSDLSLEIIGIFFSAGTDIGSNCDDCTTAVAFPFPVTFYGQTYAGGVVGANGNLQFTGNSTSPSNGCLPNGALGAAIMPFQTDLRTNHPTDDIIFTQVAGSSPNRLFGIFWHTFYFASANEARFGVLFHENDPRIEVGYFGTADSGLTAVLGVQASASGPATQFSCQTASLLNMVTYTPTAGLVVTKQGAGQGTITSSPAGIGCGPTCSAVFDVPTQVSLAAAPKKGSYFAGWSGGGCSGKGSCIATVNGPTTITARFARKCAGYFNDPRHQIAGTGKADLLVGTAGNDIICGLGGNDELRGKGGKDLLLGGKGRDLLKGQAGGDIMVGGPGNDRLLGGRGSDSALGGAGDDRCSAEAQLSC